MSDEQNSPVNNPPEQPAPDQPAPLPAPQKEKKDAGQVLMQELAPDLSAAPRRRRIFQTILHSTVGDLNWFDLRRNLYRLNQR